MENRRLLAAVPVPVGNVNATAGQVAPSGGVQVGNTYFFAGRTGSADGAELFKTDGTKAGTTLVRDINPAGASEPESFTNVNGTLYFVAGDATTGRELYKSDGTAAGTVLVKDLNAGTNSSTPAALTNVGGVLYFAATDGSYNQALYRTDGTAAGTVRVTDGSGNALAYARDLVNYNGTLLFTSGSSSSRQLYRLGSTAAGSTAAAVSGAPSNPYRLTKFNGAVYFTVSYSSSTTSALSGDLYRTDGTAAGTTRVKQIDYLTSSREYATTGPFTVSGDRLFFAAGSITTGKFDLWASDGTAAGTAIAGTNAALPGLSDYVTLVPVGTRSVLFTNTTAAAGNEPWVSDGTTAGTKLLRDVVAGTGSGAEGYGGAVPLAAGGRTLFVTSPGYGQPTQVWTTDGTTANTTLITTIGATPGVATVVGTLNGVALLDVLRTFYDGHLYRSDGTAAGTYEIGAAIGRDADGLVDASGGRISVVSGNTVYFAADDGVTGVELYKTVNGAAPVRITDLAPGGTDSKPGDFVVADDGALYFTAQTSGTSGRGLYRLRAGLTVVQELVAPSATTISNVTAVGNNAYFRLAGGTVSGTQLWKYDASTITTAAVRINGNTVVPSDLVRGGNAWYFGTSAYNSPTGTYVQQVYRIDAGAAAPQLVGTVQTSSAISSYPPTMLAADAGTVYFAGTASMTGTELYKADVATATATLVADLTPGYNSTDLQPNPTAPPRVINGVLYFDAYVNNSTERVYRSDGTVAGTVPLTGADGGFGFTEANGQVYFLGTPAGAAYGTSAVFRVNGTDAVQLTQPGTGDAAFLPYTLYAAGGSIYLLGSGGDKAWWELWQADPSFSTLEKVATLAPRTDATVSPTLSSFFLLGRYALASTATDLYLPAYAPVTGIELYRLPLTPLTPAWLSPGSDAVYTLSGSTLSVTAGTVTFVADAGASVANLAVNVSGTAKVVLNTTQHLGALSLTDSATATLAVGGTKVLGVTGLSLAGAATLDLADNALLYDYSGATPQASVAALIASARGTDGKWAGAGLTSSAAKARTDGATTLLYMEASQYQAMYGAAATFAGQAIDSTAVLVKYTINGDANFDAAVNIFDYLQLQIGFGSAGTSAVGDFDSNGTVNIFDYLILQRLFGQTLAGLPPVARPVASAPAATPGTKVTPAKTAAISGTAFVDANGNGRPDRGEAVSAGKTVWLDLDDDGVMDAGEPRTKTDARGAFAFKNLAAGRYRVRRAAEAGVVASAAAPRVTLAAGATVGGVVLGVKKVK